MCLKSDAHTNLYPEEDSLLSDELLDLDPEGPSLSDELLDFEPEDSSLSDELLDFESEVSDSEDVDDESLESDSDFSFGTSTISALLVSKPYTFIDAVVGVSNSSEIKKNI